MFEIFNKRNITVIASFTVDIFLVCMSSENEFHYFNIIENRWVTLQKFPIETSLKEELINHFCVSYDGKQVLFYDESQTKLHHYRYDFESQTFKLKHSQLWEYDSVVRMEIDSLSQFVAIADSHNRVLIFSLKNSCLYHQLPTRSDLVHTLCFSSQSAKVLAHSYDKKSLYYDFDKHEIILNSAILNEELINVAVASRV